MTFYLKYDLEVEVLQDGALESFASAYRPMSTNIAATLVHEN